MVFKRPKLEPTNDRFCSYATLFLVFTELWPYFHSCSRVQPCCTRPQPGHSPCCVQAPELSYRTHPKYPLGKHGPLEQITGNAVLTRLREMAADLGIDKHIEFCSKVETIRQQGEECANYSDCTPVLSPLLFGYTTVSLCHIHHRQYSSCATYSPSVLFISKTFDL